MLFGCLSCKNSDFNYLINVRCIQSKDKILSYVNCINCGTLESPIIKQNFLHTIQYNVGKLPPISLDLAPLQQKYREIIGAGDYNLISINRQRHIENNLNPTSNTTVLKVLKNKINTDFTQYSISVHSFRVDATLSLLAKGENFEKIVLRERW